MTKKYKLVYRKNECIGAGACEYAAPELWEYVKEDMIATLKPEETQKTEEKEILIFSEDLLERHIEAAEACPVNIIEIYDEESGELIYPRS